MMGVGRVFGEPAPEKGWHVCVMVALDDLENGNK